MEKHVVEYWTHSKGYGDNTEQPFTTECESAAIAIELEAKFHAIGWPARALLLKFKTDRILLTSKRF